MSDAIVPVDDMQTFGALPDRERKRVITWLDIINDFQSADNKVAAEMRLVSQYCHLVKISRNTIYNKIKRYKQDGWRGLVSKHALRKRRKLPEPFIDFWQTLCDSNQRKTAPAYRALFTEHLFPGKHIPGYGTWRKIWQQEHRGWSTPERCPYRAYDNTPEGWSYSTLARYAPDRYRATATRIGTGAASQYLPSVPTTRVGLHSGQYYVVDDMFHDLKVNFAGNKMAQLPLELGALDLYTGHYVVWGVKPVRERSDGTREHLKENYMRYLLAHLLCRIGIHPDGCTILGEHGTATMGDDVLAIANRYAGGRIKFEAGGIQGAPITKGLYAGRPRGNFRFKAALESHHNLKHNELAMLPGQKGMNRDHAPEELYGRDKENKALTKAVIALADERPDLADKLRRPFMNYYSFVEALSIVYDKIADRKHHNLEGFDEAGLVVQEFRLADGMPWMPMSELDNYDEQTRQAIEMVIHRPGMTNCRVMSPMEAWHSQQHRLVRLPDCAVPEILGPNLGEQARVSDDKTLSVKDPEIPGRRYTYIALATDPRGYEINLARRDVYTVHISPFDPREAYITTLRGEYVGKAMSMQRACRDSAEMQQNLGMLQHVLHNELKQLAPTADKRLRQRYEDLSTNVRELTGQDPVYDNQILADNERETDTSDSDIAAACARDDDESDKMEMAEIASLLKRDNT